MYKKNEAQRKKILRDNLVLTHLDSVKEFGEEIEKMKKARLEEKHRIVSHKSMEQHVKNSLDVIVLSMLYQEPMCGFDIIKTIVRNFDILLSQGTVYPLLYSLKKQGYLKAEMKPDNKTIVYFLTKSGMRFIEDKVREYVIAQKRILDLLVGGWILSDEEKASPSSQSL